MVTRKLHFTKCWQCVRNTAQAVTSKGDYSIYHHAMEFGTKTQKLSQKTIKPHLFHPLRVDLNGRHHPQGQLSCSMASFVQGTPDSVLLFFCLRSNFWLQRPMKCLLSSGFCLLLLIKYPNSGGCFLLTQAHFLINQWQTALPSVWIRLAVSSSISTCLRMFLNSMGWGKDRNQHTHLAI